LESWWHLIEIIPQTVYEVNGLWYALAFPKNNPSSRAGTLWKHAQSVHDLPRNERPCNDPNEESNEAVH